MPETKKHVLSLLSDNQHLKEELLKYQGEVRSLQHGLKENMSYNGRNASNNRKKMKWDLWNHCNNDIVRDFCKNKLSPTPHSQVSRRRATNIHGLQEIPVFQSLRFSKYPETIKTVVDKKYYWNQKLVLMINNKMVELKLNFNLFVKRQHLGM